jgi:hypothetical protein
MDDGFNVNTLTKCMIESLLQEENLGKDVIATKLINFDTNEMNFSRFEKLVSPLKFINHSLGVHFFSQHINLYANFV